MLSLDASHVDSIQISYNFCQVGCGGVGDAVLVKMIEDVTFHRKSLGGNKYDSDIPIILHQVSQ